MDETQGKPVCAQEALDLLNCVTQSPFDQEKCHRLLHSLRECVLAKEYQVCYECSECHPHMKVKKFSLAEREQQDTKQSNKIA